jgi:ABC-2 type transport system permease protein
VKRIWLVLVREYLENVRTKTFLFAVLMTPLFVGLGLLVPKWAQGQSVPRRTIVVADLTGVLFPAFESALVAHKNPTTGEGLYLVSRLPLGGDAAAWESEVAEQRAALEQRVLSDQIFAYVLLRPSALTKDRSMRDSEYRAGNVADVSVSDHVRLALEQAANEHITKAEGIDAKVASKLSTRARLDVGSVLAATKAETAATVIAPIVLMVLLFMTIIGTSQALITSTLEEKGSRVVEVLLSSVSPFQLMAGKVLGVCAVGLTLMVIWGTGGAAALASQGFLRFFVGPQLLLALVYYLLGFLLIGSLMVAVGSACNTLKEAQNLLSPLMVVIALPLLLFVIVMKDPGGPLATGLSFFPLFTPFLMMMRLGSFPSPPAWQIAASIGLLAVSTAIAIWLAARVFRVGILLYGKPASLREIFRWMRSGA